MLAVQRVAIAGLLRTCSFPTYVDAEDGQTMIEYGLIVGLIAVVAILVLTNVGVNVTSLFTTASKNLHS